MPPLAHIMATLLPLLLPPLLAAAAASPHDVTLQWPEEEDGAAGRWRPLAAHHHNGTAAVPSSLALSTLTALVYFWLCSVAFAGAYVYHRLAARPPLDDDEGRHYRQWSDAL